MISAMTRSCPPQSGQRVMSMSKTRFNRCAQVSGAVGGTGGSLERYAGTASAGLAGGCFLPCLAHLGWPVVACCVTRACAQQPQRQ
jgi:hypothetical protein